MADKAADGLPYGQFGAPIYNPDEHEWHFVRRTRTTGHVVPVGSSTAIAEATAGATERHRGSDNKDVPSRRREKQAKVLVQAIPELQSAAELLPELARVSEAIGEAVCRYDSTMGQLIALGKLYDEKRRGYSDAIAFAAGPTGSDLRIVKGLKQRQGWGEDESFWIETLSFSGEEAIWEGPGVSILSVVFAEPLEVGEHYLAVRLPTEVLMLRPVLRKHAPPGHSRLDANHLFSINIDETGGGPHAHFAFNPWFTGQLAIVDQAGSYSIWETGRKSSHAKKIKSGRVSVEEEKKTEDALDDGWARIAWVESTSTLCIATRRALTLLDLEAADDAVPTSLDVGLKKHLGWILDVQVLQSILDHVFILTSNHIIVYRIGRSSDRQITSRAVLQIRHHRNPEDVSLRMSLAVNVDAILLVLRSAFSPAVDQFCLDASDPDRLKVQQPRSFGLPPGLSASQVSDCQLEAVNFVDSGGETESYQDTRKFWLFYLLCKDLSLSQTLYNSNNSRHPGAQAEQPRWTKQVNKPPREDRAALLGLVEEADEEARRPPVSNYSHGRQSRSLSRSGKEWTISFERLVRRLNDVKLEDEVDIDEVIEEVTTLLHEGADSSTRPMRSLLEVADGSVTIEDTGGASERLAGLREVRTQRLRVKIEAGEDSQETQTDDLAVSSIASPTALKLLGLGEVETLSGAASALSATWFASAADVSTPGILAARNQHVKRMAADLVLASQVMRVVNAQPDDVPATRTESQEWNLPVRPTPLSLDSSQDAKPASQRLQSPALPTPSASTSTVTGSSYPLGSSAPEIARLSKYTTFTKDAPPALPRALNKVLAHWTLGADPAEYDWRSTARQVSHRDQEAQEDDMTEKERRQMQRRTERYMRRQRREAEESQRMQILSSQAPEIVSASQPQGVRKAESQASTGAGAAAGSSQSYGVGQMVASQVVPGRHGGRPPVKKKRKSGF